MSRCTRVSLANNKGGVGKSSLVARAAEGLAARGYKVLCADVDPQANLSRMLGYSEEELAERVTINEVVLAGEVGCAANAILPCTWDRLENIPDHIAELAERIDLIPGRWDFELRVGEAAGHEPNSAMARHARERFATAVSGGVLEDYDFFLMDCPPSIGPLTHMSLAAAEHVYIPLFPDYDPIAGAIRMRDLVLRARDDWKLPRLRFEKIVVNRYDPSRKKQQARDFKPYLIDSFGDQLLSTSSDDWISERAVFSEVSGAGQPLLLEPASRRRETDAELKLLIDHIEARKTAA